MSLFLNIIKTFGFYLFPVFQSIIVIILFFFFKAKPMHRDIPWPEVESEL